MTSPALVGIAHGTSSADGRAAVAGLMRAVGDANPACLVALGFVDVQHPDAPETLAALPPGMPAIVVPLLLSAGYHVHVDLVAAVRGETERGAPVPGATNRRVVLTAALGPDDRLIELLRRRLEEAGLRPEDVLVLAVAGSSDERAIAACRMVAEHLAAATARPVALGFLSAATPRLACAITIARIAHPTARIVVSSYLLAPGFFQRRVEQAGADVTASPLLLAGEPPPALLVEVVSSRYLDAL